MAKSTTDQASAASTGCCIGQAWIEADGLGLPKRCRTAAVTALTGFHVAMACSHPGMLFVGTRAFDTMARGNRMISPIPWADSGPLETIPRQAQPHDRA